MKECPNECGSSTFGNIKFVQDLGASCPMCGEILVVSVKKIIRSCKKCGCNLAEGANFCSQCGQKLQ